MYPKMSSIESRNAIKQVGQISETKRPRTPDHLKSPEPEREREPEREP